MNAKTKKLFADLANIHPELRYHQGVGEPQKITLSPQIRWQIMALLKESGLRFVDKNAYFGELSSVEEIEVNE